MAFLYKRLLSGVNVPVTATNIMTNPVGKKTYIRSIVLFNFHATLPANIKLFMSPVDPTNPNEPRTTPLLIHQFFGSNVVGETNIDPGQTIILEFPTPGIVMESSFDCMFAQSSLASSVTIHVYGGRE